MSQLSGSYRRADAKTVAVRPTLVTVIACLELAAALWDGRIFLKLDSIFPLRFGDGLTLEILMPALMSIVAIYAGVGLLQMRRGAWTAWMCRHAWLCGVYLLSIPALLWQSSLPPAFCPGLSVVITWRCGILVFSLLAGLYLYFIRGRFDNRSSRAVR